MSGGSFNYEYDRILDTYQGRLENEVLESLLVDFCKVLKSLEWYVSADTCEENYKKDVKEFMQKWLISGTAKEKIAKEQVLTRIKQCIKEIGEEDK